LAFRHLLEEEVQFQGVQQVAVKDHVENSKSIEVQDEGASL